MKHAAPEWWTLSQYLEEATRLSFTREAATEKLLGSLLQPGNQNSKGYKRVTNYESEPARTFAASSVREFGPDEFWVYFRQQEGDAGALTKIGDVWEWVDDPDEIEAWARIDWLAGHLTACGWLVFDEPGDMVEYLDIQLSSDVVSLALSDENEKRRRHTDQERRAWILARGRKGGVDCVRKEYLEHPLSLPMDTHSWRAYWREVWPEAKKGRPPSRNS